MKQDSELLEHARQVSRAHANQLLEKANVVGVGVGLRESGGFAVVVMVTEKLPVSQLDEADLVPGEIEGVPVEVRAVGELKADSTGPEQAGPIAKGGSDEAD